MSDAFALATPDAVEEPICFGTYRVLGRIAEGGMGLVLRGQDMRSGRQVAIKTVRSPRVSDAAAIRREIVALSNLCHPGIVRLYAHGVSTGMPWMAMELLAGCTLGEEMSWYWPEPARSDEPRARTDEVPTAPACGLRDRAVDQGQRLFPAAGGGHLAEVFSTVAQICLALDHLHRHGMVHRDVKPANVFLRDDGRTTLFDFGLACSASSPRGSELCVGTMEYAAPEQICGFPVDRRADIYSLGCLLYELVTGRPPFRGDSSSEIAERQMKREPVAPSHLIADVPGQLEDLVMSMLAKTPAHRPDSAIEVGQRLASIARRTQQVSGAPIDRHLFQLRHEEGEGGGRAGSTPELGLRRLPARPRWGSPPATAG